MRRTLAVLMAASLALGACGSPDKPQPETPCVIPTIQKVYPPAQPVVPVARPWQPGALQYGIQLYWHTWVPNEEIEPVADRLLNYIVGLGANSVSISFPIYTDGVSPTRVGSLKKQTPTPQQLGIVVAAAKARHLRVTLRPLVDQKVLKQAGESEWRGTIRPENIAGWFKSYDDFVLQYVAVAKQYEVEEFVAGAELVALQSQTAEWQRLGRLISQSGYAGVVSYAMSWDDLADMPFEELGVDAYPNTDLPDTATVQQLTDSLTRWFEGLPGTIRPRLTAQEVGIPNEAGMYHKPWSWGTQADTCAIKLNFDVQKNWFAAACSAVKVAKLRGIYYWMLDSNAYLAQDHPSSEPSGMFFGRPSEQSIRDCFSS